MIKVRNLPQICLASDPIKLMKRFTSTDKEREGISGSAALLGSASQTVTKTTSHGKKWRGPRWEKSRSTKEPPALSQKQAPECQRPRSLGVGTGHWPDGSTAVCARLLVRTAWSYKLQGACLLAQRRRICLPAQETRVWSLDGDDPLEEEMATHSRVLAREIPRTEEPGGPQSMGPGRSDTADHSCGHRVDSVSEAEWEEEATDVQGALLSG